MSFFEPEVLPPFSGPFDARSVCNLILDATDRDDTAVTNLALQKLLYFAHGLHLVQTQKPLVSGYFEAWTYGPVHPVAYHAFKQAGSRPIEFRGIVRDPLTLEPVPLAPCDDAKAIEVVRNVARTYARMSAGRLVDISHAKGAPWAQIVDEARTRVVLGLRIPNELILARFGHHKVSIGARPDSGEPTEEIPFGRIRRRESGVSISRGKESRARKE